MEDAQLGTLAGVSGDAVPSPLDPSFADLPLELQIKCLANCDWQTLSRAACTSRATKSLVAYLVRSPYWRTLAEEQPAVLTTEFATDVERETACNNWARELTKQLCGRGKPDICFVFVSARSHPNLPVMLRALRGHLASCTLLAGVIAPGVLGRDSGTGTVREVDTAESVGLTVSVVHLPPGSTVDAQFMAEGFGSGPVGAGRWPPAEGRLPEGPASHPRTWLMLSDKHSCVDGVLHELGQRYPGETVCGGMGGGTDGGPSLLVGLPGRSADQPLHAVVTSGTLAISISGPGVESVPLAARGMRCISQRFMISQVSPNVHLPPVGRVTLVQQLQNSIMLSTKSDRNSWVPVGPSFTPTSALVAALQAQGPNVAPRAPLFFGVRTPQGAHDKVAQGTNGCLSAALALVPRLHGLGAGRDDQESRRMVMLQMHDPNNLMRTSGYVSVQHPVEQGMISAFYTPQPALSRSQLSSELEVAAETILTGAGPNSLLLGCSLVPQEAAPRSTSPYRSPEIIHTVFNVAPSPVHGCLLFPCVAKGRRYYDAPNVESDMVAETFPGTSLAGFFCNGEIGPAPPDELAPHDGQSARMMGYSTVACMIKLTPAPPPPAPWDHRPPGGAATL